MKRLLPLLAAVLLVGPGPSLLTAGGDQPDYYPLKVGTKWDYQLTVQGKVIKATNVIDKTELVNGQTQVVQKTLVNGQVTGTEYLSTDRQGVFRHKTNNIATTPPICLIKYPVKPGETWEAEHQFGAEKAKVTIKVGQFQEVQVPAGKYKTIPVTLSTVDKGMPVVSKYWFAPNVGFVKQTVMLNNVNITMELEKYEAGK